MFSNTKTGPKYLAWNLRASAERTLLCTTFWHCALHFGWLSSSGIDLGITMQIFKWFKNKLWPTVILFAKQNIYQWCHCIIWFWKVPLNLSWFTQKHNSRTTPLFVWYSHLTLTLTEIKSFQVFFASFNQLRSVNVHFYLFLFLLWKWKYLCLKWKYFEAEVKNILM